MSITFALGTDNYRLDIFPLPAVADANPHPVDVAIGSDRAWISCEFDHRIYSVPLTATDGAEATAVTIPAPSGLFRWAQGGTDNAIDNGGSEDIDVDSNGDVWVTQMGQMNYRGVNANFSRLMRYTPSTGAWAAYPLASNCADAMGICIDGPRAWVTTSNPNVGSALNVTRPVSWFDADDTAVHVGPESSTERNGWRIVDHAPNMIAHMAISPTDGRLYVTNYWGNSVTAYNRTTLAAQTYALPAYTGNPPLNTRGPWQLAFGLAGGLWVACDYSRELAQLNTTTGTWTTTAPGLTDCNPHGIALDGSGLPWFTAYSAAAGGRIGRRNADGTVSLSPDLGAGGATGGAFDAQGRFWFGLFGQKAVGRITKL